ncbi:mevalonate kinase [Streptomyces sp. BA2]|uniref:mevalonate kinase n=1 Tax=Streptomyces sp. BA2 TaxID=436595 RepID=UPI00132119AB|nr:mevalonate kinase [Streptomyces sp. BA2]MWA09143.1 mevalonate kinase [Streptomyces sp. BA2]
MTSTNARTRADHESPVGDGRGRPGVGRAHGKAILLGEHAVVYGAPALAIPVPQLTVTAKATRYPCPGDGSDRVSFAMTGSGCAAVTPLATDGLRRLVAEFKEMTGVAGRLCVDVLIDCAIPQGRGLGSSAACARAAVLALAELFGHRLEAKAVFDLVQTSEKVAHGRASGIDALATGATSPLLFHAGTARELPIALPGVDPSGPPEQPDDRTGTHLPCGFDGVFVIADSGVGGSTKHAVEMLRRKFERDAETQADFVGRVASLTHAAAADLAHGRGGDLGTRMTENHRLLREIGLSTGLIDTLVEAAVAAGGLGAKISGGGLGGCVIALAAEPRRAQAVVRRLRETGAIRTWVVPTGRFVSHAA